MTHSLRVYEGWGEDSEVTSAVEGNSQLSSHHCLWSVALVSSTYYRWRSPGRDVA